MPSPTVVYSSGRTQITQFSPATPWPPSHSHSYLIEDEKVILVDTGIYTRENISHLFNYFQERGVKPDAIFITHGHIDHYGAAGYIQRELDVPVYVHLHDAHKFSMKVSEALEVAAENLKKFYTAQGVPEKAILTSREMLKVLDGVVIPCEEVKHISDGENIVTGEMNFKVIHVPGHSPGSVLFYDETHGIVLTGDHVLSKRPPTPLVEMTRDGVYDKSALYYMRSLMKVRELPVELALPGHWRTFKDFKAKVDALIRSYKQRSEEALQVIKEAQSALTPYEVARMLYPQMPEGVFFISVSETLGYLAILESEGRVKKDIQSSGLVTYIPA